MKRSILIATVLLIYLALFTSHAFSGKMSHKSHGNGEMNYSQKAHKMDNSKKMGEMIHHSTVDGYSFMYHLIDMGEHAKKMPEMKASHHLMLYIKKPDGQNLTSGKIGYFITGPGRHNQKLMTMGMGGGFGSDVNLKERGTYVIKTKAVTGKKKIIDSFQYVVK